MAGDAFSHPAETVLCRKINSALLEHGGNAHAAADAQSSQALLGLGPLLHLVQQGHDDPGTGRADGVAQGDGAAVDVDLAANASLASTRSISSMVTPALVMA